MRSPAHCTWNTIIEFASILRELSRRISHNINNGRSEDYVLSAGCEDVSRRFPIRSTFNTFCRAVWYPHRQYRFAHRDWFALVSSSRSYTSYYFDSYGFPPFIPSLRSSDAIAPSGFLLGTTAGSYLFGLRQILLSLRPVHGERLYSETIRRSPYYPDRLKAGFQNVRVGIWTAKQSASRRTMQ